MVHFHIALALITLHLNKLEKIIANIFFCNWRENKLSMQLESDISGQ